MLYARLSNRRVFVDWRDQVYSEDGSNAFPHFFSLTPPCIDDHTAISTTSVYPVIWFKHLDAPLNKLVRQYYPNKTIHPLFLRRLSINPAIIDYQEDALITFSFSEYIHQMRKHFRGSFSYLENWNNKTILRYLVKEYLHPHPIIKEAIQKYQSELFTKTTVGIHLRYTDKRCRIHKIERKLSMFLKQHPRTNVLLATDNPKMEAIFQKRYPSRIITLAKWYPKDGDCLHLNSNSPNRLQHGQQAITELYLLASCDYLIYDESSTFGHVASLISDAHVSHHLNVYPFHFLQRWLRHDLWNLQRALKAKLLQR